MLSEPKENLVASSSGSRWFLSGRRGRLYVAAAVMGLLTLMAWLFVCIGSGGYTLRTGATVTEAYLLFPDRLDLIVKSCNRNPEVSHLVETITDVQVKVVITPRPLALGGMDCLDSIEVQLARPLGDRIVIDTHTGLAVRIR